jgi:hypothetical protein
MALDARQMSREAFSTVWKEFFHTVEKNGRFFHAMENCFAVVPHNGKKVSTVWKNQGRLTWMR